VAKDRKPNLIEVLSTASEADLLEIDDQIAAKEKELAETTKALEGELAALQYLRRVVDVKLHGKPERKQRQAKAKAAPAPHAASNGDRNEIEPMHAALASQIVGLITKEGPITPEVIARKLDRTPQGVRMAITKAGGLFKRMSGDRVGLPGSRESED
jgi:hypothetical protein